MVESLGAPEILGGDFRSLFAPADQILTKCCYWKDPGNKIRALASKTFAASVGRPPRSRALSAEHRPSDTATARVSLDLFKTQENQTGSLSSGALGVFEGRLPHGRPAACARRTGRRDR
jgi:hypothetical protein